MLTLKDRKRLHEANAIVDAYAFDAMLRRRVIPTDIEVEAAADVVILGNRHMMHVLHVFIANRT